MNDAFDDKKDGAIIDANLQWQIDRYVLGDETFDRAEFESLMLKNDNLALAVGDSVSDMQLIALADGTTNCANEKTLPAIEMVSERDARGLARGMVLLATSAVLLVAGFLWFRSSSNSDSMTQRQEAGGDISALAENWVALKSPQLDATDLFNGDYMGAAENSRDVEEVWLLSNFHDAEYASEQDADVEDWMLEAAQVFYQEIGS